MFQGIKKSAVIADKSSVMEAETIQKNGASLKSRMSRGNILMTAMLTVLCLGVRPVIAQTLTITSPSYGTTYHCGDWIDIFVSGYTGADWQEFLELHYACLAGEPQHTNDNEPSICKFIAYTRTEANSFTFSPETPSVWAGHWVKLIAHNKKNDTWSAPQYIQVAALSNDMTVNVSTPGTLCSLIGAQKYTLTNLKVTGNLNGEDILCIREMAGSDINGGSTSGKLAILDLKDANIIASSGTNNRYYGTNTTSNNTIGNYMFYNCNKLTSITLPSSVTTIGSNAFQNAGLTGINIPSNVTLIYNYAFSNCSNLRTVIIEDGTVELTFRNEGNNHFTDSPIEVLNLGRTISTGYGYNGNPFRDNTALKSVTIGNDVIALNANSFYNCTGLQSLTLGNALTSIGDNAFFGCSNLAGALTIPNKVKTIGSGAFQGCRTLPSVTIPNSVTNIDVNAFSSCNNLKTVIIEDGTVALTFGGFNITYNHFTNSPIETLYLGRDLKSASGNNNYPFREISALKTVTIGNNVTIINVNSFYNCTGLQMLTLGNGLTSIGDNAFFGCSNLAGALTIPNKVKTIGSGAFQGCRTLPSVFIPVSVDEIRNNAFSGCSALKTVTIEDGTVALNFRHDGNNHFTDSPIEVLNLGRTISTGYGYNGNPFRDNAALKTVTIGNDVIALNANSFYNCTGLQSLTLGNALTTIGDNAFTGCSSLPSVAIPNFVTSIGRDAFSGCTALKNVTLEDGTTTLAFVTNSYSEYIFRNCPIESLYMGRNVSYYNQYSPFRNQTYLTSVTIGNSVTTIGIDAFNGCTGLSNVTIPDEGVVLIDRYAFCGTKLTSITIPKTVASIGENAFYGCNDLTELHSLNPTPPNAGNNCFSGVNKTTCKVTVPKGTQCAYQSANQWKEFTTIVDDTNTACTTGIEEVVANQLKIFPNPAKHEIFISSDLQIEKVEIYSLSGALLLLENNVAGKISVSALPQGVYLLHVYTGKGLVVSKLVKE